jgi:hypothetical protein
MLDQRFKIATIAALASSVLASCGDGTFSQARYAPGFSPKGAKVAVFAVFQGGRLHRDAWAPISFKLSPALGKPSNVGCEAAFGEKMKQADVELYAQLDQDVAENGVSDEIVARLADKTDAELIVTVSVHGRVERAKSPSIGEDPSMAGHRPGAGGGRRAPRNTRGVWEKTGMELSASLFSVKEKQSVGRISVLYQGNSVEEAITAFAAKVGAELPGSACTGWRFEPKR